MSIVINNIIKLKELITDVYTKAEVDTALTQKFTASPALVLAVADANQTISASTGTKVVFNTELLDTHGYFSNSRFQPTVTGYYRITAQIRATGSTNITRSTLYIVKNGGTIFQGSDIVGSTAFSSLTAMVERVVYFNGTTDYAEVYTYLTGSGTLSVQSSQYYTYFEAQYIRS